MLFGIVYIAHLFFYLWFLCHSFSLMRQQGRKLVAIRYAFLWKSWSSLLKISRPFHRLLPDRKYVTMMMKLGHPMCHLTGCGKKLTNYAVIFDGSMRQLCKQKIWGQILTVNKIENKAFSNVPNNRETKKHLGVLHTILRSLIEYTHFPQLWLSLDLFGVFFDKYFFTCTVFL